MHYLTVGDAFVIKYKELVTSKRLISVPSYAGFLDSDDILGDSQLRQLVSRLVDQSATANQGSTRIPTKYPRSTP